jgi:2-iminobutanoate/2-iminopropanoate deaminase
MQAITTSAPPAAIGPYAQAVSAAGLVFCSGQLGMDPATGQLAADDAAGQTRQALRNLAAVLEASGSGLRRVVKTTRFLTDMLEFAAVNAAYEEAFGGHKPARSTIEARRLPRDARVEIECVAAL